GRELRARFPSMAQILMTGHPLFMAERAGLDRDFARVFTKPLSLNEIRRAVAAATNPGPAEGPGSVPPSPGGPSSEQSRAAVSTPAAAAHHSKRSPRAWLLKVGRVFLLGLAVLGLAAAAMPLVGLPSLLAWWKPPPATDGKGEALPQARLVPGNPTQIE